MSAVRVEKRHVEMVEAVVNDAAADGAGSARPGIGPVHVADPLLGHSFLIVIQRGDGPAVSAQMSPDAFAAFVEMCADTWNGALAAARRASGTLQ